MKQKIKKLLTCVGAVGALTMMLSVPVLADTKEDYGWSDKAAADVNTYANIRSGADINTERVGMLPAGAVVTVEGEENGWFQVSSGEISGYIREDLLVHAEEAKALFESVHGEGEVVGAQPLNTEPQVHQQAASAPVSVSDSDLALMAAIIECEAGGES